MRLKSQGINKRNLAIKNLKVVTKERGSALDDASTIYNIFAYARFFKKKLKFQVLAALD